MKKQIIRLTEEDLHKIVEESVNSVKKIIREFDRNEWDEYDDDFNDEYDDDIPFERKEDAVTSKYDFEKNAAELVFDNINYQEIYEILGDNLYDEEKYQSYPLEDYNDKLEAIWYYYSDRNQLDELYSIVVNWLMENNPNTYKSIIEDLYESYYGQ